MHPRLRSALAALESNCPKVAYVESREILDASPDDPFALGVAHLALRHLGFMTRAEEMRRRAEAAPTPAIPSADELDFMRRLDEIAARLASRRWNSRHVSHPRLKAPVAPPPPPSQGAVAEARRLANEGAYWLQHENIARAEQCWLQALELDPACPQAHFYRGELAMRQGKDVLARLCFVKALHGDPDCQPARVALARLTGRKAGVGA
jgi:tetratricopeptide (TPR) repeat protein